MADAITRVGLTAKRGLGAASGVLAELAGWLEARDVRPVFETETAALAGVPAGRPTVARDDLPASATCWSCWAATARSSAWPAGSRAPGPTCRSSA